MTANQILIGDNLTVMRTLPSDSVDLIYLDPPFNTGRDFGEFDDRWDDDQETEELADLIAMSRKYHSEEMANYLSYMVSRLIEMERILAPSGSIYLHCDQTASHYLKVIMDAVFGSGSFRREVVWQMGALSGFKSRAKKWVRDHDTILFYAVGDYTWNTPKKPYSKEYIESKFKSLDADGKRYYENSRGKRYYEDGSIPIGSVFDDISSFQNAWQAKEYVSYPTQKPLALLERIIKASSNEGDVVLDPFCGSGTTLVAADNWGRQWIGIDVNPEAVKIARSRISKFTWIAKNDSEGPPHGASSKTMRAGDARTA